MIRGFFSKNHLTFSQQQLLDMYDKEVIFAIERPQNLSIAGSIVIPMAQPKMYSYQQNLDNQLGIALYRGEDGYDRDYVAAFAAFLTAAKAGDASGQYNLAEMYLAGEGTDMDRQQARYWFSECTRACWGNRGTATCQRALI